MKNLNECQFWLVVGSQHLYGPEAIAQVESNAREMSEKLNEDQDISYEIVLKPLMTTADSIRRLMLDANHDDRCAGVITWMHTFSPSKMWIAGLSQLHKPWLHLATQYNRDIPWDQIDMDFMNLNQAAHGDREHGYIGARMGLRRKVIAGHWENAQLRRRLAGWMRTAVALSESRGMKIARFGDNMREVAVTEGDKVEAQIQLGWSTNGYGVGDLVEHVESISDGTLDQLMEEYDALYDMTENVRKNSEIKEAVRYQGRLELGIKSFLEEGGFSAFTTTFEDLHGLKQLPGLAVQRLMAQGYGFGAEGDWKTAALLRLMKVMADNKGTSFMEDYTYHFEPGHEMVLGAHMLEICPTIAVSKPSIDVQPLGIGGKSDPARMVFDGRSGEALNATMIDLGNRFRLLVNEVQAVQPKKAMPRLPVARVLWQVQPNMSDGVEAWILAGGAHHTGFSYTVKTEHLQDFAEMAGIECVVINKDTHLQSFRQQLQLSDMAWKLKG